MKGEIIQNIFNPEDSTKWILIKTNNGLYSMRMGGSKKENDDVISGVYKDIRFSKNVLIQEVYTDEEWVYLVLIDGQIIAHGWVEISFEGDMSLGLKFTNLSEYEPNFFQSSIFSKLITGYDGWSEMFK